MDNVERPIFTEIYDEKIREGIKNNFSRTNGEYYMDHAGATLYSDNQIKNVYDDLATSLYGNPHMTAGSGNLSQEIIERTRYRILDFFRALPNEYCLMFTSGATAALRNIAEGFIFNESDNESNDDCGSFVHLQDNHTSVLGMRDVVAQRGAKTLCLHHDDAFKIISKDNESSNDHKTCKNNSLFVYAAESNFSGFKYPLDWIETVHEGALNSMTNNKSNWFVLLDAACYVGTNVLDLSVYKPDFVVLSFYKMFGYPTGIGALIVKNSSLKVLEKIYYGGGTVNMVLSTENYHIKRDSFHQRFEDGTVSFLSIIALQHGLRALTKISMNKISSHTFSLARYLYRSLVILHHCNGNPVIKIYADSKYENELLQGGIVAFNVLRSNGEYVGYMEVLHMAAIFKIHLRVGCFCNPGACHRHLNLSTEDVINNYDSGFICGGGKDLIDGRPTGAVRISFGYMSTIKDIHMLLMMIRKCFLEDPRIIKSPQRHSEQAIILKNKNESNNLSKTMAYSCRNLDCEEIIEQLNAEKNYETMDKVKDERQLTVVKLFIYPIKSCAAYEITDTWFLNDKGLQYDREWMVITSAGTSLTQKQEVTLCMLKPTICLAENVMKMDYPGMPTIQVPLNYADESKVNGKMCRSRVCGHPVEGLDSGTDINEWLSLALSLPNLRLIRQSNSNELSDKTMPLISFSSQAQYLLINEASVQWLIHRLPEDCDCDKETFLNRFRGNIIVRGIEAFKEESWSSIEIGENKFKVSGPCTRCQMICIDQNTGVKAVEPLKLLAEEFKGKLRFGIYLNREKTESSIISIGDSVSFTH